MQYFQGKFNLCISLRCSNSLLQFPCVGGGLRTAELWQSPFPWCRASSHGTLTLAGSSLCGGISRAIQATRRLFPFLPMPRRKGIGAWFGGFEEHVGCKVTYSIFQNIYVNSIHPMLKSNWGIGGFEVLVPAMDFGSLLLCLAPEPCQWM